MRPPQWEEMKNAIYMLLGNEEPEYVFWALGNYNDGAFSGVICLGRNAVAFGGKMMLSGTRSWRVDYRDIQNVNVKEGFLRKPEITISTPSQKMHVALQPNDFGYFMQQLNDRITRSRYPPQDTRFNQFYWQGRR
jgi:hypothetical protein